MVIVCFCESSLILWSFGPQHILEQMFTSGQSAARSGPLGTFDASVARMLLPFGGLVREPDQPDDPHVPEIVPIDQLGHDAIEDAEAEIEAEEGTWPATA